MKVLEGEQPSLVVPTTTLFGPGPRHIKTPLMVELVKVAFKKYLISYVGVVGQWGKP
jgi:hypothetical protein